MIGEHEDGSIIVLVNRMIAYAIKNKFCVLLVSSSGVRGIARYGITYLSRPSRRVAQTINTRLKVMGNLSLAERRCVQIGFIKFPFCRRNIEIRVISTPRLCGEEIILDFENKPIIAREPAAKINS